MYLGGLLTPDHAVCSSSAVRGLSLISSPPKERRRGYEHNPDYELLRSGAHSEGGNENEASRHLPHAD